LRECYAHAFQPEDKGGLLRLRSRNNWLRGHFSEAFNDTLTALKILGIELDPTLTRRQVDTLFEQVKNEILAVGFDTILSIPRTTDRKTELAVALLNDAGQHEHSVPKLRLTVISIQALIPIGVYHVTRLRILLVLQYVYLPHR
jgi:hypothetical protein